MALAGKLIIIARLPTISPKSKGSSFKFSLLNLVDSNDKFFLNFFFIKQMKDNSLQMRHCSYKRAGAPDLMTSFGRYAFTLMVIVEVRT